MNSKNAYNYLRLLMMLTTTMFVVPQHTSKFWSWQGLQQHFRIRHNGGQMTECLRHSEFWAWQGLQHHSVRS